MEHHKNEDVGEIVAVAVFARRAAHHLEDVDALHKEIGDKCFHEDVTRAEKLSYKKATHRVASLSSFILKNYFTNTLIEALMSRPYEACTPLANCIPKRTSPMGRVTVSEV